MSPPPPPGGAKFSPVEKHCPRKTLACVQEREGEGAPWSQLKSAVEEWLRKGRPESRGWAEPLPLRSSCELTNWLFRKPSSPQLALPSPWPEMGRGMWDAACSPATHKEGFQETYWARLPSSLPPSPSCPDSGPGKAAGPPLLLLGLGALLLICSRTRNIWKSFHRMAAWLARVLSCCGIQLQMSKAFDLSPRPWNKV